MAAKVYYLSTHPDNTEDTDILTEANMQVPSMEYLEECMQTIDNVLRQHFKDTEVHTNTTSYAELPTVQYDLESLPVGVEDESTHAEHVKQDSRHMFISCKQLNELMDKPTNIELVEKFDIMYKEFEDKFDEMYIKLLNTPDAVSKLKSAITIIKQDDVLNALITDFAEKADKEELKKHESNGLHLTTEDRLALTLLAKFYETGCADWNAEEDSLSYIKNKPTSMKADGGNADTVANLSLDKIINRREYDIYVGVENGGYDDNEIDMFVESYTNSIGFTNQVSVFMRKGSYTFDNLFFSKDGTVVSGNGNLTRITVNYGINFPKGLDIKDIRFVNTTIEIGDSNTIRNVTFENCTVNFDSVSNTTLEGCNFINSTFIFKGSCKNNMIIHNRADNDMKFTYKGGNNVIDANLSV